MDYIQYRNYYIKFEKSSSRDHWPAEWLNVKGNDEFMEFCSIIDLCGKTCFYPIKHNKILWDLPFAFSLSHQDEDLKNFCNKYHLLKVYI